MLSLCVETDPRWRVSDASRCLGGSASGGRGFAGLQGADLGESGLQSADGVAEVLFELGSLGCVGIVE
jgi:hypothetical protein